LTYKSALNIFRIRYNQKNYQGVVIKSKVQKLAHPLMQVKEVMALFGLVQAELANNLKLIQKKATLDLIQGQSTYTTGTGASLLPADIQDIWEVKLNDSQNTPLKRAGIQDTPPQTIPVFYPQGGVISNPLAPARIPGLPTQYTLYFTNNSRTLEIDTSPDQTYNTGTNSAYRLLIYYQQRADYFDETAGTANNSMWSDYDETQPTFGGSFKLPNEWHGAIVTGALAQVFPDMQELFNEQVAALRRNMPLYMTDRLKSFNGIDFLGTDIINSEDNLTYGSGY
jgi:hypothetical protein